MKNTTVERKYIGISTVIFSLAIITFPFYIFSSGGMQISSFLFFVFFIISIKKTNKSFVYKFNKAVAPYYFFLAYAVLISLAWCLILLDFIFLQFIAFYIFNLIVLFSVTSLLVTNNNFFRIFPKLIASSVILQLILSFLVGSNETLRASLFFNNPNQLGYFSLISASILVVFFKKNIIGNYWFYISVLSTLWLAQLSLSNATLISIIILLLYSIFSNFKSFLLTCILFVIFSFLMMSYQDFFTDRIDLIWDRFITIGENDDDSLVGRGYDRIWEHPYITIVGGGEGAVYRWNSFLSVSEIHSSWGTLLFSYGFFGFISFFLFLRKIVFSERLITFIPFFVIALYSLTHNGLRFVYFWIFLSVCLAMFLKKD